MGELQATMTHAEFKSWVDYYEEFPFDDHHRYHRPAVLVAQSMGGGDAEAKFEYLVPPKAIGDNKGEYSEADLRTLEAFGVKSPNV